MIKFIFPQIVCCLFLFSCENTMEECTENAIEILGIDTSNARVNCDTVNWQDYQNDTFIVFNGDTCITGSFNLNSNQTIFINDGNLTITGAGNVSGAITLLNGNLTFTGSFNINSGTVIECCVITLDGSIIVNSGVSITALGLARSGPVVFDGPIESIITFTHPEDTDTVLSNNSINFQINEVSCHLIDGIHYIRQY